MPPNFPCFAQHPQKSLKIINTPSPVKSYLSRHQSSNSAQGLGEEGAEIILYLQVAISTATKTPFYFPVHLPDGSPRTHSGYMVWGGEGAGVYSQHVHLYSAHHHGLFHKWEKRLSTQTKKCQHFLYPQWEVSAGVLVLVSFSATQVASRMLLIRGV